LATNSSIVIGGRPLICAANEFVSAKIPSCNSTATARQCSLKKSIAGLANRLCEAIDTRLLIGNGAGGRLNAGEQGYGEYHPNRPKPGTVAAHSLRLRYLGGIHVTESWARQTSYSATGVVHRQGAWLLSKTRSRITGRLILLRLRRSANRPCHGRCDRHWGSESVFPIPTHPYSRDCL